MDEHLTAWQIAEFILGDLDEDELEEVYRHFDECGECVGWLAGVNRGVAVRILPASKTHRNVGKRLERMSR